MPHGSVLTCRCVTVCGCFHFLSFPFFPTRTMETQQLSSAEDAALPDGPAYNFQRKTSQPTDTLNHGTGWPAAHTGEYVSLSYCTPRRACRPPTALCAVLLICAAAVLRSSAWHLLCTLSTSPPSYYPRAGMIKSAFRGSDDACHYNFNIPENAMAVQVRS